MRTGYVVKRFPRYSETFIVNEILAHEAAGEEIEIFSLLPPVDTHFQDSLAKIRAPVHYLASGGVKTPEFWATLAGVCGVLPDGWRNLKALRDEGYLEVYAALHLARTVQDNGIRHLHAHFATSATTVARWAAHLAGIPFSFTAHAKDIFHESIDDDDLRAKLTDAARVVTVSDYNVAYLNERFGDAAAKVTRIYNGLDLSHFPFRDEGREEAAIVAIGRLVEKKGFDDLLTACALLDERGRNFRCEIIGEGELESVLRSRISSLGLRRKVTLTGPLPQREVIRRLREATLMVAPCIPGSDGNRDGLPTVLLEAMALGTPCIATTVTGIPEVVRHDRTGLLVPPHAPQALADGIERLFGDAALCRRLAVRARNLIGEQFDIHRNTLRMRHLLGGIGHDGGDLMVRAC